MKSEIKTVADAFNYTGRDLNDITKFDFLPESDRAAVAAFYQLSVVREALNKEANKGENWYPDWNNYNQYKYYPWFDLETYGDAPASSGFAFDDYVYVYSGSGVGSRLCYISEEVAEYAGTQFIDLYKAVFVLNN